MVELPQTTPSAAGSTEGTMPLVTSTSEPPVALPQSESVALPQMAMTRATLLCR